MVSRGASVAFGLALDGSQVPLESGKGIRFCVKTMLHETIEADRVDSQREDARLAALASIQILDTPQEPVYDTITQLVAEYFRADSAMIAFADQSRIWIKSSWGMRICELPRMHSVFDLVLARNGPVIVPDCANYSASDGILLSPKTLGAAFFASVPVRSFDGLILGELVIFRRERRQDLTSGELQVLENVADIVSSHLELRRQRETSQARLLQHQSAMEMDSGKWPRNSDLRRALKQRQFVLYYQPEISLTTHKIVALEALIRWKHPEKGLIQPMEFVPLAEKSGLILPIGDWVLSEACTQIRKWCREDHRHTSLRVCVNLSARQFSRMGLADHIKALLLEAGVSSRQLGLEMTESSLVPNMQVALDVLATLRELGVSLLLDDFGTGFSSLNHLHSFRFDALKIDRSFVSRITEGEEPLNIVRAIVELARALGMDVVGEGIETIQQYRLLRRVGCRFGQGFLFARPMSAEDVTQLLRLPGRVLPR
jgi:EAL domain-containing protein (putative c-di-GMP-specific phosphodiesterase class I)